jgi:ADP-dependent NAD(P)H-hydrate dehydratase / NAD(P)H-hydrate epimerase
MPRWAWLSNFQPLHNFQVIEIIEVVISKPVTKNHLLERKLFSPALPPRGRDTHKGDFGSVAIIGGADGMVGAALLAARAALLSGAGRVYAALLAENAPAVDLLHPEIMLRAPDKLAELPQLDCVVIGPGLGQSPTAIKLLEYWIAQDRPLLLDADALNLLSIHPHLKAAMQIRKAASVITPHVGEAARLLGCDTFSIQQDRSKSALKLAKELNTICVLKGAGSICAHPNGEWFVNTSGKPGLASAGMGDVLSGIIASFIAQGLSAFDAVKLGVYLHGAAADALVERGIGPVGLTASEISLEVRNLTNQYNRKK